MPYANSIYELKSELLQAKQKKKQQWFSNCLSVQKETAETIFIHENRQLYFEIDNQHLDRIGQQFIDGQSHFVALYYKIWVLKFKVSTSFAAISRSRIQFKFL